MLINQRYVVYPHRPHPIDQPTNKNDVLTRMISSGTFPR